MNASTKIAGYNVVMHERETWAPGDWMANHDVFVSFGAHYRDLRQLRLDGELHCLRVPKDKMRMPVTQTSINAIVAWARANGYRTWKERRSARIDQPKQRRSARSGRT